VCVSGATYDQIRKVLPITFRDLGAQQVKNIEEPIRVYEARAPNAAIGLEAKVADKTTPLMLPDKPSIAVLPFQNMSGDPEQEYFADGMVEEIITALSRNKQLFVIARNSSFAFKGKAVDIKQVSRDLGVRYVLEGSVRKSGGRIRITGQLIDATSGAHLWADKYDGQLEDAFELQDQVASSVAGAIAPTVGHAEMERAKRKPTSSLDAYDYRLRGDAALFAYTKDGTNEAIALYERAIALDPQFALAVSGLAAALNTRQTWEWSNDPAADASLAVEHARRAIGLGRQDPLVLARCACVLFTQTREIELADGLLDEAIRLDPNGTFGRLWRGWTQTILGKHQTAIDYFQRALRLSPLDERIFFAHGGTAFAHFFLGNYEEWLKCANDALRHHPIYLIGLSIAMACSAMAGNVEAAQHYWKRIVLLNSSWTRSVARQRTHFRGPEREKLLEAYRLAGVPE
jgi:adenylate cyclase